MNSLDYSQIINNSTTGILVVDNREIIYANKYVYELLGYSYKDLLDFEQILHSDYKEACKQRLKRVIEDKEKVEAMEQVFIDKNGFPIDVEVFASPYVQDGKVYAQVHIHNITKRKLYEKEYVQSVEQYKLISENISDVITEISFDGTIQYVSPSVEGLLGYGEDEIRGKNIYEYIHPDDKIVLLNAYKKLKKSVTTSNICCRVKCKDEDYLWMESKAKVFTRNNDFRVIVDSRNVTDQIESEKLLRQSEKLAVIGELSAGVVHEIKNPLTSIKGFLQLMQAGTIKTKDYINILNSEIERIEQLANDLLGFAKPKEEMNSHNMVQIIDEVVFLINSTARSKNIQITWRPKEDPVRVFGDKSQLKQVFINLIKNAVEASETHQRVVIELHTEEGKAFVKVRDFGCGIPKEYLDKVGESFFTTKKKGTGLGLMVSHKIISNHEGEILIDSIVNEGTTFMVKMPIAR
ncbi:PAS domain S-box protein [Aquibacillus kalidii]|uniref:PAS domain S-box protein n=1 Tax=Aquibacillus kalidii TaxID=2762597 RepID=UPI001C9938EC|nr:PAS domain S-box protein [Aquibacillus kalidii]